MFSAGTTTGEAVRRSPTLRTAAVAVSRKSVPVIILVLVGGGTFDEEKAP
jgi:hypothetical protein